VWQHKRGVFLCKIAPKVFYVIVKCHLTDFYQFYVIYSRCYRVSIEFQRHLKTRLFHSFFSVNCAFLIYAYYYYYYYYYNDSLQRLWFIHGSWQDAGGLLRQASCVLKSRIFKGDNFRSSGVHFAMWLSRQKIRSMNEHIHKLQNLRLNSKNIRLRSENTENYKAISVN